MQTVDTNTLEELKSFVETINKENCETVSLEVSGYKDGAIEVIADVLLHVNSGNAEDRATQHDRNNGIKTEDKEDWWCLVCGAGPFKGEGGAKTHSTMKHPQMITEITPDRPSGNEIIDMQDETDIREQTEDNTSNDGSKYIPNTDKEKYSDGGSESESITDVKNIDGKGESVKHVKQYLKKELNESGGNEIYVKSKKLSTHIHGLITVQQVGQALAEISKNHDDITVRKYSDSTWQIKDD